MAAKHRLTRALRAGAGAAALATSVWIGCSQLVAIEEDVCGNRVIEPGEDCDTTADRPGAESCIAADLPNACRYSCAPTGEGSSERFACPDGWGCGHDNICRRHAGALEGAPIETGQSTGRWFDLGDFDGDGNLDVVSISDSTLSVSYLAEGSFQQAFRMPFSAIGLPSVADADDDGLADVLSPSLRGLALFRGSRERRLSPTTFSSLTVQLDPSFLFVAVDLLPDLLPIGQGAFLAQPGDEPFVFTQGFAFAVLGTAYGLNPFQRVTGAVFFAAEDVQGPPVVAAFDEQTDVHGAYTESPEQFAVALKDSVVVVRPSWLVVEQGGVTLPVVLLDATTEAAFGPALTPRVPPSHPGRTVLQKAGITVHRAMLAQANRASATPGLSRIPCGGGSYAVADEHADLVIDGSAADGTRGVFVAYGLGNGTFHSDPCQLDDVALDPSTADSSFETPPGMADCTEGALGAADIDGDGALDVITPSAIFLSGLIPLGAEEAVDVCDALTRRPHPDGTVFVEVLTGDFTGDGLDDVVARNLLPGVSFAGTTGEPKLRRATIVTQADVLALRSADFDGDGIQDLAFSEPRDDGAAVSVLFGEQTEIPHEVVEVAAVPDLLVFEVADFPFDGISDGPEDLLIATRVANSTTSFRFAALLGSTDRQLQAPFIYSTDLSGVTGSSPTYTPFGAAIGKFDVACSAEDANDGNAQVLFLTGGSDGRPGAPASILGSACVDESGLLTVAENDLSDLGLAEPSQARGTAVVALDRGGEVTPVVAVFNPVQGSRQIDLFVPTASQSDKGLSWQTNAPLTVKGATVVGAEASEAAAPTSPIRRWSPLLNNVPTECRLWPDADPAVVFLAAHDDGVCPEGSGAVDVPARTVLHVFPSETLTGEGGDAIDGTLALASEDEAAILGYACLNVDEDAEQEIVVVTLRGPLEQCIDVAASDHVAWLQIVDLTAEGKLALLPEPIGQLSSSQLTKKDGRPPVSGLAAGDFNRDGVDDLFIATPDQGYVWRGRPVAP